MTTAGPGDGGLTDGDAPSSRAASAADPAASGAAPAARSARTTGRSNPAPRRALSRVRPLASDADLAALEAAAAESGEGAEAVRLASLVPPPLQTDDVNTVAGRDLLIPDGGHDAGAASGAGTSGSRARKGRGAAATVPSVADLMPKAEVAAPTRRAEASGVAPALPPVHVRAEAVQPAAARTDAKKGKGGKDSRDSKDSKESKRVKGGKPAKDEPTVELVVALPKPLRKRLKTRAAELGLSPEQAVAQLVEVWVDG